MSSAEDKRGESHATALQELDATREVLIPSGTSVFEVVSMIILRADVLGIKLSTRPTKCLLTFGQSGRQRSGVTA